MFSSLCFNLQNAEMSFNLGATPFKHPPSVSLLVKDLFRNAGSVEGLQKGASFEENVGCEYSRDALREHKSARVNGYVNEARTKRPFATGLIQAFIPSSSSCSIHCHCKANLNPHWIMLPLAY